MSASLFGNKAIFISGGASGIGMETAKRMLDRGWTVGVYDICPVGWHHDLGLADDQLVTGYLDVRSWDDWDAALGDFTSRTGGRLDAFFNNAGVTHGAKACYPYLKRTEGSVMVSMSSASAIFGQPDISTYSASKYYVKGFTEALSLEWAKENIRVHSLGPLWAKTKVAEVDARSTRTLGVNLEPGEVADAAAKLFANPSIPQRFRMHHGVGLTDKTLKSLADFSPDIVRRIANKILVG